MCYAVGLCSIHGMVNFHILLHCFVVVRMSNFDGQILKAVCIALILMLIQINIQ